MTYEKTRQIYEALLNRVVKISLILLQFDKKKLLKLTLAWSLPLSLFCTSCSIGWICRSCAAASAPFSAGISVKMAIAGGGNCNSVGSSISVQHRTDGRRDQLSAFQLQYLLMYAPIRKIQGTWLIIRWFSQNIFMAIQRIPLKIEGNLKTIYFGGIFSEMMQVYLEFSIC